MDRDRLDGKEAHFTEKPLLKASKQTNSRRSNLPPSPMMRSITRSSNRSKNYHNFRDGMRVKDISGGLQPQIDYECTSVSISDRSPGVVNSTWVCGREILNSFRVSENMSPHPSPQTLQNLPMHLRLRVEAIGCNTHSCELRRAEGLPTRAFWNIQASL